MGLFSKRQPAAPAPPILGSGRRLRSALTTKECLATLRAILLDYRAPKYPHLPPYVTPGWDWLGPPDERPTGTVVCEDSNDDFLLVAFWPQASGTELGMFPLGAGDERLSAMPIIGHWKQRDVSLASIGLHPRGLIGLTAPRLPPDFLPKIVTAANVPVTAGNLQAVEQKVSQMLTIKGYELISMSDRPGGDRFVEAHRWYPGAGLAHCQRILDDMAEAKRAAIPYIQELPMRVRAILLDVAADKGSFWSELDH